MKRTFAALMVLIGMLLPLAAGAQPTNPTPPGGAPFSVQVNSAGLFGGVLLGANQFLLGQASALPIAATMPNCVGGSNALNYTQSTGLFSCNAVPGGTLTVGGTGIIGGTPNGLLYDLAGVVGNLATANNGVLVTSNAGAPSISTTLPTGLAMQTPASIVLTNGTGLLTSGIVAQSANTLLGSLTVSSPAAISVPNCNTVSNALTWTPGTGFGCNTISGGSATTITVGVTDVASAAANGILFNNAGILASVTSVNNGVLVTSSGGVPTISTTLPSGLAMSTPASLTLTNATGLSLSTGVTGNLAFSNLTTLSANTVLGAVTATTPSGLSMPSCSSVASALTWTSGAGFGCNSITTNFVVGTTPVTGGTPNGVFYDAAGVVGNLATLANGVLVTSAGSVPSISITLPNMAHGTPTSITLTNGTGLPLSTGVVGNLPNGNLSALGANTVLGALTATTPSGLAMPSCSAGSSALTWTLGGGFGCNSITTSASIVINTTTVTGGISNGLLYDAAGVVGNLTTSNNGVLTTSAGGVPSISTTLPNMALGTPTALVLTNATGLPPSGITVQSANTVLGSLTVTSPSSLAVPSCSGSSSALTWTNGVGFGCNTISGGSASTITVGVTTVSSGATNGLLYDNAGNLGNLATANNGVLVTGGTGAPSISTTLPTGLAMQTPASIVLTNGTNLPNTGLATQTANTVLGALTATTPSGLAMPSCSAATNALTWTTGTGFGCNTFSVVIGTTTVTSGTPNGLLYDAAGVVGNLATLASGVLVTSAGSIPSISTTLPNIALGTPTSITLTNATGLSLATGVTGLLAGVNGGTGVANSGFTMTVAGNLATGGALTFANMATANDLLYVTSAGNVGQLTSIANAVLVTNGTGVPSISTTLPNMAHGTPTSITLTNGTGLPLTTGVTGLLPGANGGTGVANTGFTMTVAGNLSTGGALAFANMSTTNDLLVVTSAGNVGQLASLASGVLVTSAGSVPSISTTLPNIALGTPTSVTLTHGTGLPLAGIVSIGANTVLGALTATTPSALTMPSCSTGANALIWTSGTGFGCNTLSAGAWGAAAVTSINSTLTNSGGVLGVTTATTVQLGAVEPDGTTICIATGVISTCTSDVSSATSISIATANMGGTVNYTGSGSITQTLPAVSGALFGPKSTLLLTSQGPAVTLTNSTGLTLAPAGAALTIASGNAILLSANNDGVHLDVQAVDGFAPDGTTICLAAGIISACTSDIARATASGSIALTAAMNGGQITFTGSTAMTQILPAQSGALFGAGYSLRLFNASSATITLTNSTGLTATGSCSSIAAGLAVNLLVNTDIGSPGTRLDCTPVGGGGGGNWSATAVSTVGSTLKVNSGTIDVASSALTQPTASGSLTLTAVMSGSQITYTGSTAMSQVLPAVSGALFGPGYNLRLFNASSATVTLTNSTGLATSGSCASISAGGGVDLVVNTDVGSPGVTLQCAPFGVGGGNWSAAAVTSIDSTLTNTAGVLSVTSTLIVAPSASGAITIGSSDNQNMINFTGTTAVTQPLTAAAYVAGFGTVIANSTTQTITLTNPGAFALTSNVSGACTSIAAGNIVMTMFDGTGITCISLLSSSSGTGTINSGSAGNIPYYSGSTTLSAASITANALIKSGGSSAPSASSFTDNGTNTAIGNPLTGQLDGTFRTVSGTTDTLALTDCGHAITYSSASAVAVTVNTLAIGSGNMCTIQLMQTDAGKVTPTAGTATVTSAVGTGTRAQWSSIFIQYNTTTTTIMSGDGA